jgi:hypothetical protein
MGHFALYGGVAACRKCSFFAQSERGVGVKKKFAEDRRCTLRRRARAHGDDLRAARNGKPRVRGPATGSRTPGVCEYTPGVYEYTRGVCEYTPRVY